MGWDIQVLQWMNQGLANPILDDVMGTITLMTSPFPLLIFLLGIAWYRRRQGLALTLTYILTTALSVGLQTLLQRPRPADVRIILPTPAFASFPSGHAAGAFALALLIALFWPRWRRHAFLSAALVALSRVYLGLHYPSDILAGAILGLGTAAVMYGLVYAPAHPSRPRWACLLWGQAAVVLLASLGASLRLLHFSFLTLPGADKLLHLMLFGILALLATAWWAERPAWQVVAPLAALALAEEVGQLLLPGRSADPLDFLAALGGMVLFAWIGRRRQPGTTSWRGGPPPLAAATPAPGRFQVG